MSLQIQENVAYQDCNLDGDQDDLKLLVSGKQGDNAAITILEKRHGAYFQACALGFAKRYKLTAEDASDSVQEAWLHVCSNTVTVQDNFPHYFLSAVRNSLLSIIRRKQTRIQAVSLTGWRGEIPKREHAPIVNSKALEVWSVIHELREPYRTILLQRYRDDLSIKEIAQKSHIPEGTIKRQIHTAKSYILTAIGNITNNPSLARHSNDQLHAEQPEHQSHEDDAPEILPFRSNTLDGFQRRVGHRH